jgi:hypothetical protein
MGRTLVMSLGVPQTSKYEKLHFFSDSSDFKRLVQIEKLGF